MGTQKWAFKFSEAPSSPAIGSDGTLYIASGYNLYAINPDGSQKWIFPTEYFISCPAIGSDGTVYIESWYVLYAIKPDGSLKWKFSPNKDILGPVAISSDGTIYVGSNTNALYAINPNGSKKWAFTTELRDYPSSPVISSDGTVYIKSSQKLYAINPDGSQKWFFSKGSSFLYAFGEPAISSDGTIYVGCQDKNLYAINPNGSQKWAFPTVYGTYYSSPAIGGDGTIYVGSLDNKLFAINPDGSQKWEFSTKDDIYSSPAIGSDGTIYVGSTDNKFYAINPDGSQKWAFVTGGDVYSPAIGIDGTIYVGSSDKKLYAIYSSSNGLASGPWPKYRNNNYNLGTYPKANFTASPINSLTNAPIIFTNLSFPIYTNFKWDFGDGNSSIELSPTHAYQKGGTYSVVLTAKGEGFANSCTRKNYIIVRSPIKPIANFSASPVSGMVPLKVCFYDSSTGDIENLKWNFGDSTSSNERNPTHQYDVVGIYTVVLQAIGPGGQDIAMKTNYINVRHPIPPSAAFSVSPSVGKAPLNVIFSDNSSGDITSYLWDFGDGSTSTLQNPVHTFATLGGKSVTLKVVGPAGESIIKKENVVYIAGHNVPSIDFSASKVSGKLPLTVTFSESSRDTINSRLWDFGDGQVSNDMNPTHTYTSIGSYSVSLTAKNSGGFNTVSKSSLINVTSDDVLRILRGESKSISKTFNTSGCSGATTVDITTYMPYYIYYNNQSITASSNMVTFNFKISADINAPHGSNPIQIKYEPRLYSCGPFTLFYTVLTANAPTIYIDTLPQKGMAPLNVKFSHRASGLVSSYLWNFGDGQTSSLQNPDHTYSVPGIYTVRLTLAGSCGSSTETKFNHIIVTEPETNVKVPLLTGWNLISWNVDTPNDSTTVLLASILPKIKVALGFEKIGQTFDPMLPSLSSLPLMDHLHGYWIKMTSPDTLIVSGLKADPSITPIPCETGWNLVSYLPSQADSTSHGFSSVINNMTVALGYNGAGQTFVPQLRSFSTLKVMAPYLGYWLRLNQPANLLYPQPLSGIIPMLQATPMLTKSAGNGTESIAGFINPTNEWINLYGQNIVYRGSLLPIGTAVTARDREGNECGLFIVHQAGTFGLMPVYRDDPTTEIDEGTKPGEEINLYFGNERVPISLKWTEMGDVIDVADKMTGVQENFNQISTSYILSQNYPNPFNPHTTIGYQLPRDVHVTIKVYNTLGQEIVTLVDQQMKAGEQQVVWDGRDQRGSRATSGLYIYTIEAGEFKEMKKMLLLY